MQPSQPPVPAAPVATSNDRAVEFIIPINRNGLAIAAGYVALFSFPFMLPGPVALGLGIGALVQLKKTPEKRGRGRAWFAVIYGGLVTLLLLAWFVDFIIQRK